MPRTLMRYPTLSRLNYSNQFNYQDLLLSLDNMPFYILLKINPLGSLKIRSQIPRDLLVRHTMQVTRNVLARHGFDNRMRMKHQRSR